MIYCFDPFVERENFPTNIFPVDKLEILKNIDMIIIATAHSHFLSLDWGILKEIMNKPLIYDGRRCLDIGRLEDQGWIVNAVGKPINQ